MCRYTNPYSAKPQLTALAMSSMTRRAVYSGCSPRAAASERAATRRLAFSAHAAGGQYTALAHTSPRKLLLTQAELAHVVDAQREQQKGEHVQYGEQAPEQRAATQHAPHHCLQRANIFIYYKENLRLKQTNITVN